jgi:hypothetical protein
MSQGFRMVHVVCLWICVLLRILREPTNLAKFGKENIYWLVKALQRKGLHVCYGCHGKS